jgi:hypothetical protein
MVLLNYLKYDFVSIMEDTIYCGEKQIRMLQISPGKNQISADLMYIESTCKIVKLQIS